VPGATREHAGEHDLAELRRGRQHRAQLRAVEGDHLALLRRDALGRRRLAREGRDVAEEGAGLGLGDPHLLAGLVDQEVDAPIQQAMRDANATSLAIAVVQNDKVVYQRTFGATPDTPFYLASAPKPMTALTARLLAQEKKLDLDAPLTSTLPALKLPAPLDTSRMSLRDLLTARLMAARPAVRAASRK